MLNLFRKKGEFKLCQQKKMQKRKNVLFVGKKNLSHQDFIKVHLHYIKKTDVYLSVYLVLKKMYIISSMLRIEPNNALSTLILLFDRMPLGYRFVYSYVYSVPVR